MSDCLLLCINRTKKAERICLKFGTHLVPNRYLLPEYFFPDQYPCGLNRGKKLIYLFLVSLSTI